MNKMRYVIIGLIIVLVSSVLLYDLFIPKSSDMINASGGQLDIDITNIAIGYVSDYVEIYPSSIRVKNDNKTVEIGVQNLYPRSETNISIEITNTGVLPIMFIRVKQDIKNIIDTKTNKQASEESLRDLIIQYYVYQNVGGTEYRIMAKDTVRKSGETMSAMEGSRIILKSGENLRLDVKLSVSDSANSEIESKSFAFSVTPFFIQAY